MSVERIQDHLNPEGESLSGELLTKIGEAAKKLDEASEQYKADHNEVAAKAREEAGKELTELKVELAEQHAKANDARDAEINDLIQWAKGAREPSKAWMIGNGSDGVPQGYEPGAFAYNLFARKDTELSIKDRMAAEEALIEMGVKFRGVPQSSKGSLSNDERGKAGGGAEIPQYAIEAAAGSILRRNAGVDDRFAKAVGIDSIASLRSKGTLGTSNAAGAFLIPGATVSDLVKPGRYRSAVPRLVDGMNVDSYQTTIPVRVGTPTRAAVIAWGVTKTNVDLTYGAYTATMYTMAIIYDVAKQLLRYSRGAVEQDVLQELSHAFELGSAYYILQGAGTTEPYGIQTAIGTAFGAYTSSFSPATTLAGSVAKGLATAAGALAARNRAPEAALVGAAAYWDMLSQGSEDAGFFLAPSGGPLSIRVDGLNGGAAPWGIPVYPETQLAGTDDLLIGEFSALDVFYGESYRVDTSDEAGDRWDKNLVGFRGEQEIGLDARPAVFAGAFQFIADVAP